MQEYEINGIRNLWEDFQHVVHNKKVDLMTATIGLMSNREIEREDVTIIPFNRINVGTMRITEKDMPVANKELAKKNHSCPDVFIRLMENITFHQET